MASRCDAAEGATLVDEVLVAMLGRIAEQCQGFGPEELGAVLDERRSRLAPTTGFQTDRYRGVYAVGDVTGKLPFTHAADEMGRLAAGNVRWKKGIRGRYRTDQTPWVTFTSPEVARVGADRGRGCAAVGRPWPSCR